MTKLSKCPFVHFESFGQYGQFGQKGHLKNILSVRSDAIRHPVNYGSFTCHLPANYETILDH